MKKTIVVLAALLALGACGKPVATAASGSGSACEQYIEEAENIIRISSNIHSLNGEAWDAVSNGSYAEMEALLSEINAENDKLTAAKEPYQAARDECRNG